jgi:hypothetical protein
MESLARAGEPLAADVFDGVFCALAHGTLSFVLYHALGVISPLESLFLGDSGGVGIAGIPFQPLGAFALAILFLMAATSHDFWLRNLTAPVWKTLHRFRRRNANELVGFRENSNDKRIRRVVSYIYNRSARKPGSIVNEL